MPPRRQLATLVAPPGWAPAAACVALGLLLHRAALAVKALKALKPPARPKAVLRRPVRRQRRQGAPDARAGPPELEPGAQEQALSPEEQLEDALLGVGDRQMEWFSEDEVEALHQAQSNPAALLSLLQQYGTRLAADADAGSGGSWCTDSEDGEAHGGWLDDRLGSGVRPLRAEEQQDAAELQQLEQLLADSAQQLLWRSQQPAQQQQQQQHPSQQQQQPWRQPHGDGHAPQPPRPEQLASSYDDPVELLAMLPGDADGSGDADTDVGAFVPPGALWASSLPRFDELLSPPPAGATAASGGGGYLDRRGVAADLGAELDDWAPDFEPEFEPDFDLDFELEPPEFEFDFDDGPGLPALGLGAVAAAQA